MKYRNEYYYKHNNINQIMNNNPVNFRKNDNKEVTNVDKCQYDIYRKLHIDPLTERDVNINTCFKFYDKWDPYTGERLGEDTNDPLCFNALTLRQYYYENRLNNLWVFPRTENGIEYEGYYDILIGAGKEIYIPSRGYCPEKYLFRLPIIDCYLNDDHNMSVITMGPILTDEEIEEIDELANIEKGLSNVSYLLKDIKYHYDEALNNNPPININDELERRNLIHKYNISHVNALINMY